MAMLALGWSALRRAPELHRRCMGALVASFIAVRPPAHPTHDFGPCAPTLVPGRARHGDRGACSRPSMVRVRGDRARDRIAGSGGFPAGALVLAAQRRHVRAVHARHAALPLAIVAGGRRRRAPGDVHGGGRTPLHVFDVRDLHPRGGGPLTDALSCPRSLVVSGPLRALPDGVRLVSDLLRRRAARARPVVAYGLAHTPNPIARGASRRPGDASGGERPSPNPRAPADALGAPACDSDRAPVHGTHREALLSSALASRRRLLPRARPHLPRDAILRRYSERRRTRPSGRIVRAASGSLAPPRVALGRCRRGDCAGCVVRRTAGVSSYSRSGVSRQGGCWSEDRPWR